MKLFHLLLVGALAMQSSTLFFRRKTSECNAAARRALPPAKPEPPLEKRAVKSQTQRTIFFTIVRTKVASTFVSVSPASLRELQTRTVTTTSTIAEITVISSLNGIRSLQRSTQLMIKFH
jgi:hypothetical protein